MQEMSGMCLRRGKKQNSAIVPPASCLCGLKTRLAEVRHLGKPELQLTDESALVDKALRGIGTHPLYDSHICSFETERHQEERLKTPASERLTFDVL